MTQDRKEYYKKYYKANKEKRKAYYEANKEKRAAQMKVWYQANKEKKAAYEKAYYEANKEKRAAYTKDWLDLKKDGLYTVYLLVNEDYVGQTNNLYSRLITHRNKTDRDTSNVQIIGKYKTREQAMEVEAGYHARGYLGYHNNL